MQGGWSKLWNGGFQGNSGTTATGTLPQGVIGNTPGLTFYKYYDGSGVTSVNADYGSGSSKGTFTATRSATTPATYIGANGSVQLVTTSNIPRYQGGYYDSTGFQFKKGILMERASTNYLLYTNSVENAAWSSGTARMTRADIDTGSSSPDGTATAMCLTANGGGNSGLRQDLSGLANVVYNFSVWLKRKTGTGTITLRALSTDTVTDVTAYVSATKWTRISVPTSAATTAPGARIGILTDGDAVYVYGPQIEPVPYPTSYIGPVGATALTRNAESLSYVTSNNRTAATESIFIKFAPCSDLTAAALNQRMTGTDTKLRALISDGVGHFRVYPNASDSAGCFVTSTTAAVANTSYVVALTMASTGNPNCTLYVNGTSEASTNTDFTANAWGTNFYVGTDASANYNMDGIIQAVAIYNRVLTASEVLSISNEMALNRS